MIHYFAYGSNLHPVRLQQRVPSARLLGCVKVSNHRLLFNKQSHDGSGKCHLLKTGVTGRSVYGAIYQMQPQHKESLDQHEGKGNGYMDQPIDLHLDGQDLSCFTYLAQDSHIVDNIKPYHWYKELVELGARYCQFPDAYIQQIAAIESQPDPSKDRTQAMEILIREILQHHQQEQIR